MNDQSVIKIIRLNTGEDVIANCVDDEANTRLHLGNPMSVIVKRVTEANKAMLIMMPWLPLEIIEEDSASINYQDIITIIEPKQSFIEYYSNTVEQYKAIIEMNQDEGDMFDSIEEDDDEEEMDSDTMQEMLNLIKEKKKNSLH